MSSERIECVCVCDKLLLESVMQITLFKFSDQCHRTNSVYKLSHFVPIKEKMSHLQKVRPWI